MKGKRRPIPRSKPSMTTYIIRPNAMMTAQMIGRSMPISIDLSAADAHSSGVADGVDIRSGQRACRPLVEQVAPSWCGFGAMILRPLAHELQHVGDACAEHGRINDDEHEEGGGEFGRGMVGDCILSAHDAVDYPGLAADFRGQPSREDRDKTRRSH